MPPDRELSRSRHLQMMGQLSETVAHDMNNLLSGVLGYSELLMEEPLDEPLVPYVQEILKAGKRLAAMTHLLLIFREREYRPARLEINRIIQEMEKFLTRILQPQVRLIYSLHPETWQVLADPAQIQKVLFLLAFEMKTLIPQGGQFTLSTENITAAPDARQVRLTATASVPMPFEKVKSIIVSGDSTEESSMSGKSISQIIAICGGHIAIQCEPDQPSSVQICLPAL